MQSNAAEANSLFECSLFGGSHGAKISFIPGSCDGAFTLKRVQSASVKKTLSCKQIINIRKNVRVQRTYLARKQIIYEKILTIITGAIL